MSRSLHFSPEALAQLDELETYLAERAGSVVVGDYLERLLNFCDRLAVEPIIGHRRDDLLPGLLTRTFEKSRVVCFLTVGTTDVHVLAIYGTRQDWERRLQDHPPELPRQR